MKFSSLIKLFLLSLVLAPVFGFLGLFIVGAFSHSSDIMKLVGMCIAPGTFLFLWLPHSAYFIHIVILIEFLIIFALGLLFLRNRDQMINYFGRDRFENIVARLFRS